MFCTDILNVKAAISHKCTSCGEPINKGDLYKYWKCCDESWTTNKMHPECFQSHEDNARQYGELEWEYSMFDHQRGKADLK